ncbi:M20/M25/M40 family metallo-hydrolase [Streptomyces sp. NPDC058290]|uniref:M20/M25/M40 family metallo-hydrolase n=1 Tax=Streptomyces sp. NPDC058290 TaxID=3346426 RepID=UPI0036EA90CB
MGQPPTMSDAENAVERVGAPGRDGVANLADWVGIASVFIRPAALGGRHAPGRIAACGGVGDARPAGRLRLLAGRRSGRPGPAGLQPPRRACDRALAMAGHPAVRSVEARRPPVWAGASDAKGQIMCHLWALRTHLEERSAPAVTVKYLVEEEEIGSVHLADLLSEHADDLNADVVMVSDSMLWSLDEPTVCAAVRGSVTASLTVRGGARDIHSGVVSGAAASAPFELCRLLGLLSDDSGRVALPGFYDAVADRGANLAALDTLPFDLLAWLADTGTFEAAGEAGFTVPERLWARPSVEVARLTAGRTDAPALGLIPAKASADLLFRLVPDQRADHVAEQLRTWLDGHRRPGFTYALEVSSTISDPYRTPPDHPALMALTRAVSHAYGAPAGHIGNGGATPAAQLARACTAPVLFFGTGLPGDRWHGPEERVEIQALRLRVRTLARFLDELAAVR